MNCRKSSASSRSMPVDTPADPAQVAGPVKILGPAPGPGDRVAGPPGQVGVHDTAVGTGGAEKAAVRFVRAVAGLDGGDPQIACLGCRIAAGSPTRRVLESRRHWRRADCREDRLAFGPRLAAGEDERACALVPASGG